jgi:DNA-binding transcriptional LysR family regulator
MVFSGLLSGKLIIPMVGIQFMNVRRADLNLLVIFDALLSEGSVTRAAKRVGLSQPAMSSALNRLRQQLADPVLIRTPAGMKPTSRAIHLIGPVRQILQQVEAVLAPRTAFHPASAKLTFRIATNDYVEFVLIPKLINRLSRLAPGINLEMLPLTGNYPEEELQLGRLDLALGFTHGLPERLHNKQLIADTFVCIVRNKHPTVGRRLTLKQYVKLPHLLISQRGSVTGVVDRVLEAKGLQRHVAATVPHFLAAPIILSQSDYVLTLAERVARTFAKVVPLRILRPPIALKGFSVRMAWHERTESEPAQQWFRQLLLDIARDVQGEGA